ncbi:MAG: lanthionine synthetase LanC family protein, partial [Kofleriaceae bacterium]
ALLGAGLWVDDNELRDRGLALGLRTAGLGLDRVGVHDATLCHGAAGNAHVFNRMFQATGEVAFADAARAWFARTLELRTTEPIAGFSHRLEDGSLEPAGTLIFGAPGVGLILHAAITEQEPSWDRLFLMDLPVQSRN